MNEDNTNEEKNQENSNQDKQENDNEETYSLVIKNGDHEYEVGSFSSSAEITANEEQFNQLLSEIQKAKTEDKKLDSIIDGISGISSALEKQRKSEEQTRSGTVEPPSDYYEYTADVMGQINFFVSLIFGLMVSFLFVYGIKR